MSRLRNNFQQAFLNISSSIQSSLNRMLSKETLTVFLDEPLKRKTDFTAKINFQFDATTAVVCLYYNETFRRPIWTRKHIELGTDLDIRSLRSHVHS